VSTDSDGFFGLYRGTVFNNRDPLNQGRLKLRVPQVLADQTTGWAWRLSPASSAFEVPAVGQGVWVMFEGGNPAYPIWVGMFGKEESRDARLKFDRLDLELVPELIRDLIELTPTKNNQLEFDVTQTLINIAKNRCYGSFFSTQTITAEPNVVKYFPFEQVALSCGNVSVTNANQLRLVGTGVFNVQFSAQFVSTVSAQHDVDIWLVKNGQNVAYTNTRITLSGNGVDIVPAWNFFIEGGGETDYWQFAWSTDSNKIILHSEGPQVTPTRPGIPSVILTVSKVK